MNKNDKKESKLSSDIFTLCLIGVFVFFGIDWVIEYENCGKVTMHREMLTLFGEDAMLTAYLTTIITIVWFVYSAFILLRKWRNKKAT